MSIADLWYKNAIIYCLDVEKYQDANGDGIGDFEELMRRLDYLQGLGVTCVWLQPFYPSPNRDNGYDVADFYGVNDKHGSLGDFVAFMRHADALGIRVIIDLVVTRRSIRRGFSRRAPIHTAFFATGMSGAISGRRITRMASCSPASRRPRGRRMREPVSTTFIASTTISPI
jgi:Alpha amylase, catalytic domain